MLGFLKTPRYFFKGISHVHYKKGKEVYIYRLSLPDYPEIRLCTVTLLAMEKGLLRWVIKRCTFNRVEAVFWEIHVRISLYEIGGYDYKWHLTHPDKEVVLEKALGYTALMMRAKHILSKHK